MSAQKASALAELRQRKTGLEAELQALKPCPRSSRRCTLAGSRTWKTPRQRLEGEARQAREQLATELAERRRQAEQALEQER